MEDQRTFIFDLFVFPDAMVKIINVQADAIQFIFVEAAIRFSAECLHFIPETLHYYYV